MAKQFVEGNKYVFSAKKFKNHMGKKNMKQINVGLMKVMVVK